jgi:DivIVA domain-containing protein
VELDRQSIEKRDFPIGRRGYDPAAVDAHLRTLASDIEELQRAAGSRGGESLGSSAGTQVQSILEAAETTAAGIERDAAANAQQVREEAARDAHTTRDEAVARARAHVEAVTQATATLLQQVESMDGEVGGLVQSLRAGAGRLAADLAAVETNMGELYDAASGQASLPAERGQDAAWAAPSLQPQPPAVARQTPAVDPPSPRPVAAPAPTRTPAPSYAPVTPRAPSSPQISLPGAGGGGDLDGARLIALNMALNGESRVQTDRYLAENFELPDRTKLLDEVYAAIEG